MSRSLIRRSLATASAAVTALVLVACSEPSEGGDTDAETTAASGDEQTTITVYTSEPEEKVDEINAAFMEAHPDISVEVYRAGTGDLNARIESEKASGGIEADVLWAADSPTFEGYAADGDLAELQDVDTEGLMEEVVDEEGYYVGTRIIPTVIAYNTDVISEDDAPQSWQDLTDPEYMDQLVMPDPAVSGAAAFNASVWLESEELGEEWLSALAENQPMIAQSNGPTSQEIASGSRPVGVVVDYLVRDLADAGSPIATAYPEEGAPYITEPAGAFEASENKEAAETYINFLLSEEAQNLAVEQAYLPVREGIDTPEDTPALEDINLLNPDLEAVTENQDDAVSTFQELMS
ncbi:ABC transporter substrate-binding protein [Corynebacterium sp. L4756]|uniref:ABC transporter substrate-binding protein n=1 Tax=unclassified Corynebacterium TaxID=2624378 RepID=UPI00374D1E4D